MTALAGRKTVTTPGTPEALGSGTCNGQTLYIKALAANTGLAEIGDASSAASGFELAAGEVIILDRVVDLSDIYVDVTVGGEGVCWIRSRAR